MYVRPCYRFLGYDGKKTKESAPAYIVDSLWNEEDENEEKSEKTEKKDIHKDSVGLSRIFKEEDKNKWWSVGESLTPAEEVAVVRSFQSFSRLYSTDVCFRKMKFGTKIMISGPVRKEKERMRE